MVEITYDQDMLRQVERKLGRVKSEAPKALKNALNQTARQATNSKLDATIFVKGKVLNITNYKTSTPKKGAKAQVKKDGGLKQIIGPKGITAFKGINDLLWQRRGKERYPIKPLKSLSIPKAIGNEKKVYGVVRPDIKKNLKANVDAQVRKILGR